MPIEVETIMKNHSEHIVTDSILIRYLQKQTSEDEDKNIESWLLDSPDNQSHFNSLKKIWEHSNSKIDFDLIDTAGDWEKVKSRIENAEHKPMTKKLNSTFSLFVRIAAIIVLAVGITFLLKYYLLSDPEMIVQATEFNQSEILLSDGSKVYLNKHSEISYPEKFSRKERVVNLKGEAYFEVSRNEKKSFTVHTTNNAEVSVLGTSFNIHTDTIASTVTVNVTSGKVAFYKVDESENKTILTKNEKAVLEDDIISKSTIENLNFLSWKTGILEFKNIPLTSVVDQLAEFYKQTIIVNNQSIGDFKYTSTIDNQPLEEALDEINIVFNLDYIEKNDTIFIYPNQ